MKPFIMLTPGSIHDPPPPAGHFLREWQPASQFGMTMITMLYKKNWLSYMVGSCGKPCMECRKTIGDLKQFVQLGFLEEFCCVRKTLITKLRLPHIHVTHSNITIGWEHLPKLKPSKSEPQSKNKNNLQSTWYSFHHLLCTFEAGASTITHYAFCSTCCFE